MLPYMSHPSGEEWVSSGKACPLASFQHGTTDLLPTKADSPMFACFSSLSRDTSLMAVQGAPSSCSSRISFRATRLSVSRDRPLYTVAYVPCELWWVWLSCCWQMSLGLTLVMVFDYWYNSCWVLQPTHTPGPSLVMLFFHFITTYWCI